MRAILDGAQQIAVPAFVSTLCICIVFVPVVFLTGAGQLPVHAAGAGGRVRHAGLLPALAHAGADDGARTCCASEVERYEPTASTAARRRRLLARSTSAFNRGFERLRDAVPARCSSWALAPSRARAGRRSRCLRAVAARSLLPFVGQDFFPPVDAGQFRLHVRAPAGTRIEETEQIFAPGRGRDPRRSFPPDELGRDPRQHRPARQRHQPRVQRQRARSAPPTARSWSRSSPSTTARPGTTCAELRAELPQRVPRADLLLPAGRHRRARSSTSACPRRSTCRWSGRDRAANYEHRPAARATRMQRDPRRGRRARAPGRRRARAARRRRPHRAPASSA